MQQLENAQRKSIGRKNKDTSVKREIYNLAEKIKHNEIICYPTEKSGRFLIDSLTNYIESMQPHLQGIEEFTLIQKTGQFKYVCMVHNCERR